ncbi:hypothetical protein WJX72_002210 [[Myrmecia] bisecta]|uniref:Nuclear pore complex protein Nup155 n=1 Tax=[Myrmecia] bisecta TaxID=41462 RepID=A0AAW1P9H8_9CHLO
MASSFGPPPGRWQSDSLEPFRGPTLKVASPAGRTAGKSSATEAADTDNAWKHVKTVIREEAKGQDLQDLLSATVQETQYSLQPPGWPSLLRPLSVMGEMPAMVLERYNACQTVCFCGVFPEIKRAWASVDNSLFLWRYDINDVPVEYSAEEQAICAVGLARPRPGVFVEAIQHVLVLCTTVEIVLLGVCLSPGNSTDPLREFTLQQLPLYSVSSDSVPMTTVTSTPTGRIFVGGADGHLYEIMYSSGDSWRQKRCYKVRHSGSLLNVLPSWVPSFRSPSAIVDIQLDNDRHILYTRLQNSAIQVFDMGAEGKDAPRKVAEVTDLPSAAMRAARGRDIFGGRSTGDKKGAAIAHIAVIPPTESQRLHLLAVTSDGRRVYFSTYQPSYYGGTPANQRPQALIPQIARQAMPHPSTAGVGRTAAGGSPAKGLEVSVAHYCNGVLLLAEMAGNEGRTRMLMASRDLTIPPVGTATGAHVSGAGFRETITELEMLVPGEACAIKAVPTERPPAALGANELLDELSVQHAVPAQRFVLVSTAGVLELEKRRAVDVVQQILEERSGAKLEQFFKSYGAAEVAAMCFMLATMPQTSVSSNVIQQARAALENPRLTGEAAMKEESGAGGENMQPNLGFDMGMAVPVAEPEWSGAHKGLALFLSRLLRPAWEEEVVGPVAGSSGLLQCRIPAAVLQVLEDRLRALDLFLGEYQQRRRSARQTQSRTTAGDFFGTAASSGRYYDAVAQQTPQAKRPRLEEAAKQEDNRISAVRGLVARAAEACYLLHILSEHHMGRLAARMDDSWRARLRPLKLRDWVCSSEGEAVAAQLISVLVTEHLSSTGGVAEDLAASLQAGCPSYFKEDDKIFYQASGYLQRAEATSNLIEREQLTQEALRLMMKVPLACDLGQVVPQLTYLRCFEGVVELPLRKAAALDPDNLASRGGEEGRAAREARLESCYSHSMTVLRFLVNPAAADGSAVQQDARMLPAEREQFRKQFLQLAAKASDPYFHEVLYTTLVDMRAVRDLLALATPQLERHLRRCGGLPEPLHPGAPIGPLSPSQATHLEILAKLYISQYSYDQAAAIYQALATRRSGAADQAVSLAQRLDAYQNALLQAKSHGDAHLIDVVEVNRRLLEVQIRMVEVLRQKLAAQQGDAQDQAMEADSVEALQDALDELEQEPRALAALYNDYCQPGALWGLALELAEIANHNDTAYIRQLWDVYLRQGWDEQAEAGQEAQLAECAARVEGLGQRFYPNDVAFPAAHVALRLEQVAAGQWPERAQPLPAVERVAAVLLKACGDAEDAVLRIYDALLSVRGSEEHGEELHAPLLRLRLLRSALFLLHQAANRQRQRQPGYAYRAGARREVGLLTEAAERYANEARRLQPADVAEDLARSFGEVRAGLDALLRART